MRASIAAKSRRSPNSVRRMPRGRFGEIPTSRCSDAPMGAISAGVRRQYVRSCSRSWAAGGQLLYVAQAHVMRALRGNPYIAMLRCPNGGN
jgi:hypothetical protein